MHWFVVVLTILVAYAQSISYQVLVQEQWVNFKLQHNKFYKSQAEEKYRSGVFMRNLHKINEHNKLYAMGLKSHKLAINRFGDLPEDEFLRLFAIQNFSSLKDDLPPSMKDFIIFAPPSNLNVTDLPGEIDWRDMGAVTPVKDQGDCGSCWSFSATGVLEGQWFKHSNQLISLSEQNLMDCSWKYRNAGCDGGWTWKALRYVKVNGGIDTEASYPYQGTDSKECKYSTQNKGATVSKVVMLRRRESELQIKVGSVGPMAVAIEMSYDFQFYSGGVYDEPRCRRRLNHAVLAVGYGSKDGKDYWLVKNSWGTSWGESGYILMSRNKRNQCGIASEVSYPLI